MTLPEPRHWIRVEEIAEELEGLPQEVVAERLGRLRDEGESASVLSLVSCWLALPPPPLPLTEGELIGGRYVLERKLGEGGMGCVWEARQKMIGRKVAIKFIHQALVSPALRDRFAHEMEILGRLVHPGIVRIFDAGEHEDERGVIPFFTMEFVEGAPLGAWATLHREDRGALIQLMTQICAALQHAHDHKVVHRDLKPGNVIVRPDGQPVVLDFGVARLTVEDLDDGEGVFSGTPHYAAPEQHLGRDRDFRSGESVDVYAAGAVLFEMLTGRRLFAAEPGTTLAEVRRAILEDIPTKLSDVLPDCPPLLNEVVSRAVRRDPADRYYSVGAFARALTRAAASFDTFRPPLLETWKPAAGVTIPGTQWTLEAKVGEGGVGEVWKGSHETLPERRVFKFCSDEEKARSLKRELTVYRLLKERVGRDSHFIQLHEASLDEAPWYLMMDDVGAEDLESWCQKQEGGLQSVDLALRIEIIAQAAEALQVAHECGILHRDIKPSNILISGKTSSDEPSSAGDLHIYVADFGLGTITVEDFLRNGTRLGFTRTFSNLSGSLSGTMLYIAPEVVLQEGATARSDIYSLGVVFWQLLIGNLHAALDATDALNRVDDPLLREDLSRCLASNPARRWSSAGEFAKSLRDLPKRRAAESQRQAELARRAREAYRRGVLRTASVAAVVLIVLAGLAATAWVQREEARRARAQGALEQAANIVQLSVAPGRTRQGTALLKEAAEYFADTPGFRSIAAGLGAREDMVPIAAPSMLAAGEVKSETGEGVRVTSGSGKHAALGEDVDGLEGRIRLVDPASGAVRSTLQSDGFPYVPVPEPGMMQFSADEERLAVAGPETSHHVLIWRTSDSVLESYIFARGGIGALAWHPGSRIIATGGTDGSVRWWDVQSGGVPNADAGSGSEFRLPPQLSVTAIDTPIATLDGWRGGVCAIAFHERGEWMAALDDAGWLRIWRSFLPIAAHGTGRFDDRGRIPIHSSLVVETKLERAGSGGRLAFEGDRLTVSYPDAPPLAFQMMPSEAFREARIAPALLDLAWNRDGSMICVITPTDSFWINANSLKLIAHMKGGNPGAVAFDPEGNRWALPRPSEFIRRWPDDSGTVRSSSKDERWQPAAAMESQASRIGLVSAVDGRMALFFGKRLQFVRGGRPEPLETSVVTGQEGGDYRGLLWDWNGAVATVLYAVPGGIRAESFKTTEPRTEPHGTVTVAAQQLVSAGDGVCLIARSIVDGIFAVNLESGEQVLLDRGNEARQPGAIAVSADGRWIAAVVDRNVIRLIDATRGVYYANLSAPRSTGIAALFWHPSGDRLAALTDDGFVQVWSLSQWREQIAELSQESS